MKTKTFIVLIPVEDNRDARPTCETIQATTIKANKALLKVFKLPYHTGGTICDEVLTLLGLDPSEGNIELMYLPEFMDRFNDEELNPDDYFMSYIHLTI